MCKSYNRPYGKCEDKMCMCTSNEIDTSNQLETSTLQQIVKKETTIRGKK